MKKLCLFLALLLLVTGQALADSKCDTAQELMSTNVRDFSKVCQQIVASDPACKDESGNLIDYNKRMSCSSRHSNEIMNDQKLGPKVLQCIKGFLFDSVVDLVKFVGQMISALAGGAYNHAGDIVKFLMNPAAAGAKLGAAAAPVISKGAKAAVHAAPGAARAAGRLGNAFLKSTFQYFTRDYPKALAKNWGNPVAALGDTLGPPLLKGIGHALEGMARFFTPSYDCMNGVAKLNVICRNLGGFVMPPTMLFSFLKYGVKGLQAYRATAKVIGYRNAFKAFAWAGKKSAQRATRASVAAVKRAPAKLSQHAAASRAAVAASAKKIDHRIQGKLVKAKPDELVTIARASKHSSEADDVAEAGKELATHPKTIAPVAHDKFISPELKKMADLSAEDRIQTAQLLVKRDLSVGQEAAIIQAHDVGTADGRGYLTYTLADLREKTEILKDAGFSKEEADLLMRKGVTGGIMKGRQITPELAKVIMEETVNSSPKVVTSQMKKFSQLGEKGRISEALRNITYGMSPEQEAAFTKAFNVGTLDGRNYLTYTQADLTEKVKILQNAHFEMHDIQTLMGKGLLGKVPDDVPANLLARENQFVRLWDSPKVDAVLVDESIKANPTKVTREMEGLSNLSMDARIDKAYGQISFGIHETQKPAFIKAYEVGTKDGRSYLTYTKEDLREKVKILQDAGFDDQDIQSLMKKGFLGTTENSAAKVKPETPLLKAREEANIDNEVEAMISANAKDTPALIVNYSKDPEYAPLFKAEKMYPDQNRDIAIVIRDMEVKNPQLKPSEIRKEVEGLLNTCELK